MVTGVCIWSCTFSIQRRPKSSRYQWSPRIHKMDCITESISYCWTIEAHKSVTRYHYRGWYCSCSQFSHSRKTNFCQKCRRYAKNVILGKLSQPALFTWKIYIFIYSLSGNTHSVVTGLSIFYKNKLDYKEIQTYEMTQVKMTTLSDTVINSYVESGEPL